MVLKKLIEASVVNQVKSIQSGINISCTRNLAAQILCSTLLKGSYNFLVSLHNFIDAFYFKLWSGDGASDANASFFTTLIYCTTLIALCKQQLIGQQAASTGNKILKCALAIYMGHVKDM